VTAATPLGELRAGALEDVAGDALEEAVPPRVFGFAVSTLSAQAIADRIAATVRKPASAGAKDGVGRAGWPQGEANDGCGVGLVVTPNVDHVRLLRRDPQFAAAYASAAIVTCDGFPVYHYARLRGCAAARRRGVVPSAPGWVRSPARLRGCAPAGRVTGCDLARALLRHEALPRHRLFFVADSDATAAGLRRWAVGRGMGAQVALHVPPHGFEHDPALCAALAGRIAAHGTTLLLMGVGAPRSEVFVHSRRAALPPCWALCVGQALRIEAGVIRRAPALASALNAEWLWRLAHEPRRLTWRYAAGAGGFLAAVAADLRKQG